MKEINNIIYNITVLIIMAFISIIIASKNQPENVGLGGLAIFIFQPLIMIITLVLFFILRSIKRLKQYSWMITLTGIVFSIYFAFFGYINL